MGRSWRRHAGLFGAVLLGGCLLPEAGRAALTREFTLESRDDLLAGEQAGVSITAEAGLAPAPTQRRFLTGETAYVWSLATDGRGGVYAGTGSDGRVYRLSPEGAATLLGETLEYELFALVAAPDGTIYFAGAPNGTVMRRTPGGQIETLVDLPQGVVWDLILTPAGELFAASGDAGEVYRIHENGRAEIAARTPDTHAASLAWWRGRIVCGTDGRGLLIAFDPASGRQEVLYDTDQEEVVAILPLPDRLLFAANGDAGQARAGEVTDGVLPVIEVRPPEESAHGYLYELRPDGLVRLVWQANEKRIFSLAQAPDGRILVGTGDQGRLYALDDRWQASRLADLEESDLLALAVEGQRVFLGAGNSGAVYFFDYDRRREGLYTAKVQDAGAPARWGAPRWQAAGEGRIVFETRTGQTNEPDETWSDWLGLAEGRVTSPAARFLQWRVRLSAEPAEEFQVGGITLPYRGPNRPPVVERLEVSAGAPELFDASGSSTGPLRQEMEGGVRVEYSLGAGNGGPEPVRREGIWTRTLRTASWTARDPDGDELIHDLYLGFAGEGSFYPLKLELEDRAWTWEAAAWPDGWYRLKLVVHDGRGNVPGEELSAEALSAPFQIDNTPPRFLDLRVEMGGSVPLRLTGVVEDDASRILSLEVSPDGEGWRKVLPADGIFDSQSEVLSVPILEVTGGRRPTVIGVRASDEVGHLATARLRISS